MARPRNPPDPSWRPFAQRLAEEIHRLPGGYRELARRLNISEQSIRAWRTTANPTPENVERTAEALQVDIDALWPGWSDGDRPGRRPQILDEIAETIDEGTTRSPDAPVTQDELTERIGEVTSALSALAERVKINEEALEARVAALEAWKAGTHDEREDSTRDIEREADR